MRRYEQLKKKTLTIWPIFDNQCQLWAKSRFRTCCTCIINQQNKVERFNNKLTRHEFFLYIFFSTENFLFFPISHLMSPSRLSSFMFFGTPWIIILWLLQRTHLRTKVWSMRSYGFPIMTVYIFYEEPISLHLSHGDFNSRNLVTIHRDFNSMNLNHT